MKPDLKKLVILNLPYLLFVYLFGKLGEAYRLAAGADLTQKMLHFMDSLAAAFANGLSSFHPFDLCIGVAGAVLVRLAVYLKGKNAKKYRHGMEYGSARWGGAKDIAPYIDPVFENNILLTQTERLMMNGRPKDPKTARNKNVLVIGGSGSGKTRFFVKPNLMQMHSSYCITDPKGSLLIEVGQLLRRGGYRIKVLNTINFSKSMRYNPFAYVKAARVAGQTGDRGRTGDDESGQDFRQGGKGSDQGERTAGLLCRQALERLSCRPGAADYDGVPDGRLTVLFLHHNKPYRQSAGYLQNANLFLKTEKRQFLDFQAENRTKLTLSLAP